MYGAGRLDLELAESLEAHAVGHSVSGDVPAVGVEPGMADQFAPARVRSIGRTTGHGARRYQRVPPPPWRDGLAVGDLRAQVPRCATTSLYTSAGRSSAARWAASASSATSATGIAEA